MNPTTFDARAAGSYAGGPQRQVPGYSSLHHMASLLIAERTPQDGRVLVLGAGGGQELKAMADAHPGWSFDGVDPSVDMLHLAAQEVGPHAPRMRFHHGYIDQAPGGPFDAATCILVFHFIPPAQRLETIKQVWNRLRVGAPFVLAHLSFPQTEPERSVWIDRHLAFGRSNGLESIDADRARQALSSGLTILPPEEDVAMLRRGGFANASLFYAGLSMRGWVAYADKPSGCAAG
jgi:tRNA (cmo5U34)-methyltransferase